MTGLNKIIQTILSEADSAAAASLVDAKRQAQGIMDEAKKQGEIKSKRILQQSDTDVADSLNRAKSAAALQKKKNLLVAKQQMIQDVIDRARQSLYGLPPEQYFTMVLKMAAKYTLPQEGKIVFSKADLERLPARFQTALDEAVKKKGAVLSISSETREIDGGFILIYGDVEQNCSFQALFEADQEKLLDKVHELLFL